MCNRRHLCRAECRRAWTARDGKSQTITNLIATLTANGKKVLFVAEKEGCTRSRYEQAEDGPDLNTWLLIYTGPNRLRRRSWSGWPGTLSTVRGRQSCRFQKVFTSSSWTDGTDSTTTTPGCTLSMHRQSSQSTQCRVLFFGCLPTSIRPCTGRGPDLMQITLKPGQKGCSICSARRLGLKLFSV